MKKFGKIIWQDLSVENAVEVKDFYSRLVGWESSEVSQGDYSDFNMHSASDNDVIAGICHKRGYIENFPSQWLNYVMVENLSNSL